MANRSLARSSKALMQRVQALIGEVLPRQAIVTRPEGSGVWVRFISDSSTDPESRFPSTVSGVPAGTMGWVVALAGGKGLFIVTNVAYPVSDRVTGAWAATASTAGSYFPTGTHDVTVTGLNPNREYTVEAHIDIRTTGTTERRFQPICRAVGSATVEIGSLTVVSSRNLEVSSGATIGKVTPAADGTLVLTPGFSWTTGTVTAQWASLVFTVS